MANTTELNFLFTAQDRASAAFRNLGDASERTAQRMDKLKAAGTVAAAAVGVAAVKFAKDSIAAFADAQASQSRLEDAYKKFPSLATTNIGKLRDLNAALQQKTGYDDDDTAAAQASLAQYKLSGDQIARLTPLLQDYAAKTGRDLPSAAKVLGKAMLGQGKALKDVGINFTDTKSLAGNFSEVMSGLTNQVGGFAESGVDQAAKKSKILAANFGDLQETVGSKLQPALTKVTEAGIKVLDWLTNTPGAMKGVTLALGAVTAGLVVAKIATIQWNATLLANPITWIAVGVIAAIAGIVLAVKNWGKITDWLKSVWAPISGFFKGLWSKVAGFFNDVWGVIKTVWNYSPYGLIINNWGKILGFFKSIPGKIMSFLGSAVGFIKKVFSYTPIGLVVTNFGKIVSFIKGIPGKILRGLGDLKDLLLSAGGDVIQGLLNGITGGVGKVIAKVGDLASSIKDKFTGLLDIFSPSKVFHGYGRNIVEGLVGGLDKNREKAGAAIARIVDKIKNTKGLQGESALLRFVKAEGKALDAAWKSYDAAAARLVVAKDKLTNLIAARSDMAANVKGGITGQLDLGQGIKAATEATTTTTTDQFGYEHTTTTPATKASATFASAAGVVKSLAAKAKAFAGKLSKMVKVGIPAGLVQQIAGMGIDDGTLVADAYLSGTAKDIKGLQSSWATLQKYAGNAGSAVSGQVYNGRIGDAKDDAKAKAQKASDAKADAERLAKAIAKEFRKELAKVKVQNEVHMSASIGVDKRTSARIVQDGTTELKRQGASGRIGTRAV